MTLPLLISLPHAGTHVPEEVSSYCRLSRQEVVEDGDEGAAEIYSIGSEVQEFVTTEVARAVVDMNRAEDDRRADGVVKTHTCWGVPVYREFPPVEIIESLIAKYHRRYHAELTRLATRRVRLGVDCHTMAKTAPPIAPDPGSERPVVCLSNADGTCSKEDFELLADCLTASFGSAVSRNDPFQGGYIVRSHAAEMPWVQLELTRAHVISNKEKRRCVLEALRAWCCRAIA